VTPLPAHLQACAASSQTPFPPTTSSRLSVSVMDSLALQVPKGNDGHKRSGLHKLLKGFGSSGRTRTYNPSVNRAIERCI
jgi:hypothetical protein